MLVIVNYNRSKTAWFNSLTARLRGNMPYYSNNIEHLIRDTILGLKSRGWQAKIEGNRVWIKTPQMVRWHCVSSTTLVFRIV